MIKGINELRRKRSDAYFDGIATTDKTIEEVRADLDRISSEIIGEYRHRFSISREATFFGEGILTFDTHFDKQLDSIVRDNFERQDDRHVLEMKELCKLRVSKGILSNDHTGIIIAGFGTGEIFPTLCSYEIDGIVCNRLKYAARHSVDIDRLGRRAAVLPYAQKEMVERFLYGTNREIESELTEFCRDSIHEITQSLLDRVDFEDEASRDLLLSEALAAEEAFIEGLTLGAFKSLRSASRIEIETMVEFMPKPELAKMAEALVNLTWIKRRISRGFETVGGPIDVAVISRTEGFIWVKRKHYFDGSLNTRYLHRVRERDGVRH